MKLQMFSIYDEKASSYIPPFFLHNEAMAQRSFADCVNDPQHAFNRNPSDYTLFHLAEFDDSNGTFDIAGVARSLGNGLHFLRSRPVNLAAVTDTDTDNAVGAE